MELSLVVEKPVIYSEMTLKHSAIYLQFHDRRPDIWLLKTAFVQEKENNSQEPSKFSCSFQLTSDEATLVVEATRNHNAVNTTTKGLLIPWYHPY